MKKGTILKPKVYGVDLIVVAVYEDLIATIPSNKEDRLHPIEPVRWYRFSDLEEVYYIELKDVNL